MIRRGLLLAALPIVAGLFILGASTAQAQESEVQPGPHLLCTMQELAEHGGICPAQTVAPEDGVRLGLLNSTQHTVTVKLEPWAAFGAPMPNGTYWVGWRTATQSWMEGVVNASTYTAGLGMSGPIPAGTSVTVWAFPVVPEVEWVWGEPCQSPNGYSGPCGHYRALSDPSGGSVTTTTLNAPRFARRHR